MTKSTRGRASKVDLLPDELKEQLHALLRNKANTQLDVLDAINELIEDHGLDENLKLSRSGLNRYASQMETVGKRIAEAREISKQWVEQLGAESESQVSSVTIEMLRSIVFDVSMKASEKGEMDSADLKNLTLSVARLENAAAVSQKRIIEARKEFAIEAVSEIEAIGKAEGLTDETVQLFKNKILGIA